MSDVTKELYLSLGLTPPPALTKVTTRAASAPRHVAEQRELPLDLDKRARAMTALYNAAPAAAPKELDYPQDLVHYEPSYDPTARIPSSTENVIRRAHILGPLTNARIRQYELEGKYGPEAQQRAVARQQRRISNRQRKKQSQQKAKDATEQLQQLCRDLGLLP